MIVYLPCSSHHYHRHRLPHPPFPTERASDRRDGGGPISIEPRMHEIWLENDLSGRSLRRRQRRRRHCPLFLSPSLILPSVDDAMDAAHPTEQIRRLFLPIPKGIP